ncbi:MarR family transcriptional regulator [Desulfoprunum benzoelyticum]|uniref:DNA-binding MarR family transcriptional regulator n=1 Tax=Desulfoprunum benzoelyticum TaxID=1506996 RepID=A0A840USG2_9BACT|nr:MarR family transcriptional regulator [Desulfoprunum benzoelyticum]MBB5348732.1 DNA-binding MarR family transcriptional regulator [Desulfoprunum benzoelyticum]MBM9529995.1 MarR family transcriptional regulator [Desulfoprunum benzoelyticum]
MLTEINPAETSSTETNESDWGEYNYKNNMEFDEKVIAVLLRASETVKKDLDTTYKNYGLTFSQYNVLRILNNSKNGQNKVNIVSKIMLVSSSNITGVTQRLEKIGLLLRKQDPSDERITVLEITPKGSRILKNIQEAHLSKISSYLNEFSSQKKKSLFEDLKKVYRDFRR